MDFQDQLSIAVGKSVKARRIKLGITIQILAEYSGLSNNQVSIIERGKSNISLYTLFKLASGLGLNNPNELLLDAVEEIYPLMKKKDW